MTALHLLPMTSVAICFLFLCSSLLFSVISFHSTSFLPWKSTTHSTIIINQNHLVTTNSTLEKNRIYTRLINTFPYNRNDKSLLPHFLWQTWKYSPSNDKFDLSLRPAEASWSRLNPDYMHITVTDLQAQDFIRALYSTVPEVYQAYNSMPLNVHRADFFRYLVLYAIGGTYSDIDTDALKPISEWIPHDTIQEEEVGIIVGIEADPNIPDWSKFYARRLQFCQWTIQSKPGHPILADIIAKITQETLRMQRFNILSPDSMDISTMEYTGPGAWTDSIFDYFNNPFYHKSSKGENRKNTIRLGVNVSNIDFTNQENRRLVADVLVLPVTSFSPGMGRGAKPVEDPLAFVMHRFQGEYYALEDRKVHQHLTNLCFYTLRQEVGREKKR